MGTHLAHVRANVSDLHRAVEWYESVLGFEVDEYWPVENPTYVQFRSDSGATYSLGVDDGNGARFNFVVDDPDAVWERLSAQPGITVTGSSQSTVVAAG